MFGTWFVRLAVVVCAFVALDAKKKDSYTWDDWTAFDEYVNTDDGYYSYEHLVEHRYDGVTVYVINMTSQRWLDDSKVSKSVWWHIMGIAIPDNIQYPDAGFLFIDGGSNRPDTTPPGSDDLGNMAVALLANDTGTCGGYIKQIPNQPIVFADDPSQRSRSEDSIIAWTWRTYIEAAVPDPTIILRMPMVKGAKRGLDTVRSVALEKASQPTDIKRFVVAGASKRGWTTWSLAGIDRRVIAIIPMVMSMINIEDTVQNHFRNMNGAYSFAFNPYYEEDLTKQLFNPQTDGVWDVEDVFRYRDRLQGVVKLELVSSGDEFFLADDSQQWWDEMPEPKYLLMLPNSEHSMAPHYVKIYETAASFWSSILQGIPLPTVTWSLHETGLGGYILFNTNPTPKNITVFSATTLDNGRRDFRLAGLKEDGEVGIQAIPWRQDFVPVDLGDGLRWVTQAEQVDGKWVGFFFQGTWEGPIGVNDYLYRMVFTSQVNVIPYTWPRGPCVDNDDCYGYLV